MEHAIESTVNSFLRQNNVTPTHAASPTLENLSKTLFLLKTDTIIASNRMILPTIRNGRPWRRGNVVVEELGRGGFVINLSLYA